MMKAWYMFLLANTIEQTSSWEADSRSASQEIYELIWNPKVNDGVLNSPILDRILSELNSVLTITHYLFNEHFNIILQSTLVEPR
jgi:hypothetical protein